MKLITCDAIVGLPRVPMAGITPTVDDLLSEMARLDIASAVVRHRFCMDNDPCFGNRVLIEDLQGHPNLIPAWCLTPDGEGPSFDVESTVRRMLASGVKIAWMFPKEQFYSVRPWCSGKLYGALQAAGVPLLVDYDQLTADDIHDVCTAFPRLRLLLNNVPRLGRNRLVYTLLERHPHLHLCFNHALSAHEGFPDLCARFGVNRWVLGTGYPHAEGGCGITGLMYAGLDSAALRAVAHENIERLLSETGHA
jgi:hypothetical protein